MTVDALSEPVSDRHGRFGEFGGRYVPEALMAALDELEREWETARSDEAFIRELDDLLSTVGGRPTPLYEAKRFSERCGSRVLLKREDLAHTGAHKINNTLGQVLLAKRMSKTRIIAETGAGQHGVATATAAAWFGLPCVVYMGATDVRRQYLNVVRMRMLGAEVVPVEAGSATLKDAINEALRDWVTNVESTHYVIGSVVGPHPYPELVASLQSVIGNEARAQVLELTGRLPAEVVACVGGGSNAVGLFRAFYRDEEVTLVGVEAAGEGLDGLHHLGDRGHVLVAPAREPHQNEVVPAAAPKDVRERVRGLERGDDPLGLRQHLEGGECLCVGRRLVVGAAAPRQPRVLRPDARVVETRRDRMRMRDEPFAVLEQHAASAVQDARRPRRDGGTVLSVEPFAGRLHADESHRLVSVEGAE